MAGGERSNESIKIMGVSVSGLKFAASGGDQDFLFEEYKRPGWVTEAMDRINNKYGEYTIVRAGMHNASDEWAKDTVGFSRMRTI